MRIGILGGGQLGRMLSQAAEKIPLKSRIFSDQEGAPACLVAESVVVGDYKDEKKLKEFSAGCDVITYEFENIPLESIEFLESNVEIAPNKEALATFQNRIFEKRFLSGNEIPCADFEVVKSKVAFEDAVAKIGIPCVLKTAGLGYDGKGQSKLATQSDVKKLKESWIDNDYVLETLVDLELEFSVVAARGKDGEFRAWQPIENEHRNHILHISVIPARISRDLEDEAIATAKKIADGINYVGVLCVEFFLTKSGKLLVNEIAPRVHNSGHLTIEASPCSQFEQHMRAIAGKELGDTGISGPHGMLNLLGDLWARGEPNWEAISQEHKCTVHLYGKKEAKKGRKMGHLTFAAESSEEAYNKSANIFSEIVGKN